MASLDYDYIAKLVEKAKQGDSNAFAELYTATYQKQYRFTYRYVKDQYRAQDILQDVYIIVLKNIHRLKNPRLFVSWLNQINFRVCYDVSSKTTKQAENLVSEDELQNFFSRDPGPEATILKDAAVSELREHILSLPPKEAQTIIMRYYNDMTIDEIADAMDMSRSTVKRSISSAKKQLERLLTQSEGRRDRE
jgi:RNA polymerase sigma-70 factor (ECF subfamily)